MRRGVSIVLVLLLGGWFVLYWTRTPLLERASYSRQVFDKDGRLLRVTLSGDEKYRIYTPLNEVSEALKEVVLLHEDRHFYRHFGVNPASLVRAMSSTYLMPGARRVGGSTITMQLARSLSTRGSRSISGKLFQILGAIEIELFHSKDEIFEAYLNFLPYGSNIEGIGAASLIYFGKRASELTLPEALHLALVPQNPNVRSTLGLDGTLGSESDTRFRAARKRLLEQWLREHPEDRSVGLDAHLPLRAKRISDLPFEAPHFVNEVLSRTEALPSSERARLVTTLDSAVQGLVENKLRSYVAANKRIGIQNGAAIVVDSTSMSVVAMVGSVNFFDAEIEGQVNGVFGKRSPGSSLKPFVYALAIDQGIVHPQTLLKDSPTSFGGFDPENFDLRYVGPVTTTNALTNSRNVPAVSLASQLKSPSLYGFLKDFGVRDLKSEKFYGLAVALGGAEVSMAELVQMYAALANLGTSRPLRYLTSEPNAEGGQTFSAEAAFLTLDMLRQNQRGDQKYAESWMRDAIPVAWKTGTSHGFRDAWTTGVIGPYVVSVWLGNFNGEGNPALIGREKAAPLFFSIADGLRGRARQIAGWQSRVGLNLKKVKVCAVSGKLPGKHCRHEVETMFIPGKSPIHTCDIHREILVSKQSGLRACREFGSDLKREVFEFWPSDLMQVFRSAGVPRKSPPAFESSCKISDTQTTGIAPAIISPRLEVEYSFRVSEQTRDTGGLVIPLAAVADGDVSKLHWFVGKEYIGQTEPQKPAQWRARPGKYTVRVVDDLGRTDSRVVEVRVVQ